MLEYNQIKKRKYIVFDGEPYEVLDSKVFRKQQRKPVNQTKLRNMVTGKVTEQTFQQSEKVEEADIIKKEIEYIYTKEKGGEGKEIWFMNPDDPSNRFQLQDNVVEDKDLYLKEGDAVEAMEFDSKIIGISLPIKMQIKVKEAPPSIKGNTSAGGTKQVKLATGAVISTPLFVEKGDTVEVNTETGEYVGRVQ